MKKKKILLLFTIVGLVLGCSSDSDDNLSSISFQSANLTVNEDGGTATITVTLNGDVPGGFSVNFETVDGTATQSDDYTSASGALIFNGNTGRNATDSG